MVIWEVKQKISPPISQVAELTATNPYILCQNIALTPTYNYSLHYDLYSQMYMSNMVLTVKLNGNALTQLVINQ